MSKTYCVYIMASRRNGTLYIGMTNDLVSRVYQHKNNLVEGFTEKYGVQMLVHYETTESAEVAIRREKQLKEWQRQWKISLIEEANPDWRTYARKLRVWIPAFAGMTKA